MSRLRRRVWGVIVLCVCLPLILAGCPAGGGSVYTLSTLQIAGLRHLPGLERILDADYRFDALGASLFQSPDDPTPRALLNVGGQLEEAELDGSGERSLTTTSVCAYGTPAVTPDGQWGACLSDDTFGQADHVEIVALAAGAPQHDEVHLRSGDYYGMVWSPDGTQLALVADQEQDHVSACTVQLYRAGVDHRTLALTTTFTSSPQVSGSYGSSCAVLAVGWSPDGRHLEIAVQSLDQLLVATQVAVPSALGAAPTSVVIPRGQFVATPIGNPTLYPTSWNPHTGLLALVGANPTSSLSGKTLRYYPTPTGQVGTWFGIVDMQHTLRSLAWSPDGRQLLLLVGGPFCVDTCAGIALPDAYLYTPPSQ